MYSTERSYIDVDALVKADKSDPSIVYIEASNQLDDAQKDVVLQKALKDQVKPFLKKGVVSWNHLHKIQNDPKFIVGEPLDVAFPDDGRTLVKARLYPSNDHAKDILAKAHDGSTRLGASIGGYILKRKQELNKSYILSVLWDEVAITHQPVNEDTLGKVTIVPFADFSKAFIHDDVERLEELSKALAAGYGTDASTMTGGRALTQESLMGSGNAKRVKPEQLTAAFKAVLTNIRARKVKTYKDLVSTLPENMKSFAPIIARVIAEDIDKVSKIIHQGGR
jgi:hypothetical protein